MERTFEHLSDSELLATLSAVLDALTDDRLRVPTDAEQLELLATGLRLGGRLQAWQQGLAARIESSEAAWTAHGTSTTTWLSESLNLTPREARRLVNAGQDLVRFPRVAAAAAAGAVLPMQAGAITEVLRDLPDDFPADTVAQAEDLMVGFADSHNSAELRRLTSHLLEALDPDGVEVREAERLERERRRAERNRHLTFSYDYHGSVLFTGSVPVAEGEAFVRIIDAYAASAKRGLDRLDPHAEHVSPSMGRADALLAMVHAHSQLALAPVNGGDRLRIVVTLSYDKLVRQCIDAGLVGSGESLSAAAARQLLCDAHILPVVLGGDSEVLDVGRTERLVTPAIRTALEVRDGGCVFPGCDKPPEACQAHHIIPWRCGGSTALWNLVLLCPHHHGICEPGTDPDADRWQVRLRPSGCAEIIPPKRVDPTGRPRIHARNVRRPSP